MSVATQGDEGFNEEIGSLIEGEFDRLFGWVMRQIGDYDTACDIVQDTCLDFTKAVRRNPEILESPSRARNTLYTIASRRIADFIRRKTRRRHRNEILEFDPEGRPELDRELAEEIEKSLDRIAKILSPREWDVLRATYIEGESDESIARRLGIEPVSVRQIRSRAIKKLRDALGS